MKKKKRVILSCVGKKGIGKTCLFIRYTCNAWPLEYIPSTFDNFIFQVHRRKSRVVDFEIRDPVDPEEYSRLRPAFDPTADVFMACFAVNDRSSLEWLQRRVPGMRHCNAHAAIVVNGTKRDTREKVREKPTSECESPITFEEGVAFSRSIGAIAYCESSSALNEGVHRAFNVCLAAALSDLPFQRPKQKSTGYFSRLFSPRPPVQSGPSMPVFALQPPEVWLIVFSFLGERDLCTVAAVCRDFRRISEVDELWAKFVPEPRIPGMSLKRQFLDEMNFIPGSLLWLNERAV